MFKVLEIDDPEWVDKIECLLPSEQDIHFYPQMLTPYVKAYGWSAKAAVSSENGLFVLQPILITHDGQLRHAYNFGGPISNVEHDDPFSLKHEDDLIAWARQTIEPTPTSYYVTLNPFLADRQRNWCSTGAKVKDTVYIDLEDIKFRGTTRRAAEKAWKSGATLTYQAPTVGNLEVFHSIYHATMDRAQATPFWYMPKGFFQALFESCPEAELHLVEVNGEYEAGCIVIMPPVSGNGVAYYAYAGSLNNYPRMGINHMMVSAVADYCRSHGCTRLHLGGGLTDDPSDGLFIFKSGFSDLRAPVYTYNRKLG